MKKILFLSILFIINIFGFGQSYFMIENLYVEPENPDTRDTVSVILSGVLADSGSRIDTTYSYTEGFEVFINVESSSTGGFQVTSDRDEGVQIGFLNAGSYHINLILDGAMDNINDTSQYYFEVTPYAQIPEQESNTLPFVFYPNPCKDFLFTRNQSSLIKTVDVFDLEGKMIQSFTHVFEIDISSYPPGVYILRGNTTAKSFTQKIVKQ